MIETLTNDSIGVLLFVGTRPEAIKMAPLALLLKSDPRFEFKLCLTGQHSDMLYQALDVFGLKADVDLKVMEPNQDLSTLTAKILVGASKIIKESRPDIVLVHGDTTTAYAVAMAAFYSETRVGHVEAGLRTKDIQSPFPEEFNRQAIARIAFWNFTPTEKSKLNLLAEGVPEGKVFVTGNTVVDASNFVLGRINSNISLRHEIESEINEKLGFDPSSSKYVLITQHRRENLGEGLLQVLDAIAALAARNPNILFVFPVHLNPRVQESVREKLSDLDNVRLCGPISYQPFTWLLSNCMFAISDSGGIQEEAIGLGRTVLVTRENTERPEGLETGLLKICGTNRDKIVSLAEDSINNFETMVDEHANLSNPYGDGRTSEKILEIISKNEKTVG